MLPGLVNASGRARGSLNTQDLTPKTYSADLFRSLQVRQFTKDLESRVDLFTGQRLQALSAEALDRKRSHHAAIKERALQAT